MKVNLKKIRGLMAEHGDTQKKLAEKIGVSTTTVSNYLMGKSKMTVDTVNLISTTYKVDFNNLLEK